MSLGTRTKGYLKQFIAEVVGSLPLQQEGVRDICEAEREERQRTEKVSAPPCPPPDQTSEPPP